MNPSEIKKRLRESVWDKNINYYSDSRQAVLKGFEKTPFLNEIKKYCSKAKEVLDCGCGDGTDIELIWNPKSNFTGIDLSKIAVRTGNKRFKKKDNVKLLVGDIESLSFPNEMFDCVYSLHVVEHLSNPEKAVTEIVRVLKPGGYLIIYGSNYGHPLEFPPSTKKGFLNYLKREVRLLLKTHVFLVYAPKDLSWDHVYPLALEQGFYTADSDTTIEPYLHTLLKFLKKNEIEVVKFSSAWEFEKERSFQSMSFLEKIFEIPKSLVKILARLNLPPYKYYGPALYVVGRKR